MNDTADCTLPEKILLAAADLEEAGQSPFSAEALIVSAWKRHPQAFGLKGYEAQHPDSNKVLAGIMGEKGLPKRGWMVKVGQKLYALTRDGRQVVSKLLHGEDTPPLTAKRPGLEVTREQDLLLQSLLSSAAYQKLKQNRQVEWTFSEACKFWQMEGRQGDEVDARLEEWQAALNVIERRLGDATATLGNGRTVKSPEVASLLDLHHALEQRFIRHLNLLRHRG